jgi:hypothetical protein
MTTNPNDENPLNASGQTLPASADTNTPRQYGAQLCLTVFCTAFVTVEASSLVEAKAKADKLCRGEVKWEPVDGHFFVDAILPIDGGQSHE